MRGRPQPGGLFWVWVGGASKLGTPSNPYLKKYPFPILEGLSDPAPTSAPSKTSPCGIFMDGIKLFPRGQFFWSIVFFSFWAFFFSLRLSCFFGANCFFSQAPFGLIFFPHHPWHHLFFWELYLPLQATYRPSSYQPIYLPHSGHPSFVVALTCITNCIINTWDSVGPWFRVAGLWVSRTWEEWGERIRGARGAQGEEIHLHRAL